MNQLILGLALGLLVTGFAGCLDAPVDDSESDPVPGIDPTEPFRIHDLELPIEVIEGHGTVSPYVVQVSVRAFVPESPGPLVILLHGRHGTCAFLGVEWLGTPCPETPVSATVPNHLGYDQLAERLAQAGFLVASLDANEINDRDNDYSTVQGVGELVGIIDTDDYGMTARAKLVLGFLEELQAVLEGGGNSDLSVLRPGLSLDAIGLMGHSRGGEGVVLATDLNDARGEDRFEIRSVFALAPTDFDRQKVGEGVELGVLLPYCDGDVSNLQGAWLIDDHLASGHDARATQHLAYGANHNWYNAVWTGSDWTNRGDPHCDLDSSTSGRLSLEEQLAQGTAIMGDFFLQTLAGSEPDARTYDDVLSSVYPPSSKRIPIGAWSDAMSTNVEHAMRCSGSDCDVQNAFTRSGVDLLRYNDGLVAWQGEWPVAEGDLLQIRLGIDSQGTGFGGFRISVMMADGVTIALEAEGNLEVPPGEEGAKTVLNDVVAELPASGVIQEVRFELLGSHRILLDQAFIATA